jgi:hypothetical protein
MDLEKVLKEREEHGVVVRHYEEIDSREVRGGLEVAKRLTQNTCFRAVGQEDLEYK